MNHSYIGKYSDLKSPIHKRDPRAKIITLISFIIIVVTTAQIAYISFAMYLIPIVVLILISKVPFLHILKRLFTVIPFVLLIAIFIPFLKDGNILWKYSIHGFNIKVTYEGLVIFGNIIIKAFYSVLCLTLLIATTSFADLLKGLELLRIPKLIVMIFSFMYRYIFVLQDELMVMLRAKNSRSINNSGWSNIKALSNMLGLLFIRSYERGEFIYYAMYSRGFDGEINTMNELIFTKIDLLFCILLLLPLIAIRISGI